MKIFLTGGSGLLGSHIADLARSHNATIKALVRPASETAYLEKLGCQLQVGTLQNQHSLVTGMNGCDLVIHAASPLARVGSPKFYQENIVQGTQNVVNAMKTVGIKKLIYISTVSVYGLDPLNPNFVVTENYGNKFLPFDYYGKTKVIAEKFIKKIHEQGEVSASIVRPGWLFGPRDNNSYGRLADGMRKAFAVKFGEGNNHIPLVYVGNIAELIWHLVEHPSPDYRVLIYPSDGLITQEEYLKKIAKAAKYDKQIIKLPVSLLLPVATFLENLTSLLGYQLPVALSRYAIYLLAYKWHFETNIITKQIDFKPTTSLNQGLELTEKWYQKSRGVDIS